MLLEAGRGVDQRGTALAEAETCLSASVGTRSARNRPSLGRIVLLDAGPGVDQRRTALARADSCCSRPVGNSISAEPPSPGRSVPLGGRSGLDQRGAPPAGPDRAARCRSRRDQRRDRPRPGRIVHLDAVTTRSARTRPPRGGTVRVTGRRHDHRHVPARAGAGARRSPVDVVVIGTVLPRTGRPRATARPGRPVPRGQKVGSGSRPCWCDSLRRSTTLRTPPG